jgi:hypothetical protein
MFKGVKAVMIKLKPERIETILTVVTDHDVSDKYPGQGQKFRLEDEYKEIYYYDTMADVEVFSGEKWLVKMTIVGKEKCIDTWYKIV